MGMIHTGVFNKELVPEALAHVNLVNSTPVVILHGKCLFDMALEEFKNWIDSEAVKAGLPIPEKDGDGDIIHYGFLGSGEFTKWDGVL